MNEDPHRGTANPEGVRLSVSIGRPKPDPLAASPVSADSPDPPTEERRLGIGFYVAFFSGCLFSLAGLLRHSTLAGVIGFGGPLLAVVIFFLWGFFHARFQQRSDLRQKFGDSCYFLGFLFTMVAMMVGFLPTGLVGNDISSQEILRFLGMALGATALGLIFRIMVLQSGRTLSDDAIAVESELHLYASRLSAELKGILEDVATVRATLPGALSGLVDQIGGPLTAGVLAASQGLEQAVANSTGAMMRQAETIDRAAREFGSHIDERRRDFDAAASQVISTQSAIAASAASINEAGSAFVVSLQASANDATAAITETAQRMRALGEALARVSANQVQLDNAVARIQQSADRANASFDTIGRSLDAAKAGSTQLPQRIDDVGQSIVVGFEGATQRAAGAIIAETREFEISLGDAVTRLVAIIEQFSMELRTLDDGSNSE